MKRGNEVFYFTFVPALVLWGSGKGGKQKNKKKFLQIKNMFLPLQPL
jgi:hypothetical protein